MRYRSPMIPLLAAIVAVCLIPSRSQARSFALYAHAYLDSSRVPSARITAEVPFKSLVFLKKEGWYDARYEVYLAIERIDDGKKEPRRTAVLRGNAVARSYGETARLDLRSKAARAFALDPGKYRVSATLRMRETDVVLQRSLELEVPDFLAAGIGFGSPTVVTLPPGGAMKFARLSEFAEIPAPDNAAPADVSLALFDRQPAVRFEIYLDGAVRQPLSCEIFYEVISPDGRQVLYGKRRVELSGDDDAFILPFNVDDWEPGAYRIKLRALTEEPVRDASSSVMLNVDMTRAMLGRNFDDTLEILALIATDGELKGLREAAVQDRAREWSNFWAARNPEPTSAENPALQEHLRRVRYVMKAFSTIEPGWRTDRGQVYIRHGAPDRIETASDSRHQGEYEIWRYYGTGRVYVFYDMFGLGDYRLVQGDMF